MKNVDEFLRAAREGDAARIKSFLDSGVDVESIDALGRTAFIHTSIQCHFDAAKILLLEGANIDARDFEGMAAVNFAVKCRSEQRARRFLKQLLVKRKANLNNQDLIFQDTPIITTAKRGYFEYSWLGRPDLAKILIEGGADLNARNSLGRTALVEAVANGGFEIAKLLIEAGADLNAADQQGKTALMHAARSGAFELIEILIEAGADPTRKDHDGKSASDLIDLKHKRKLNAIVEKHLLLVASKLAIAEINIEPIVGVPSHKRRRL